MLELTNHCNLACTTCPREYNYGKAMDKGNMTVQHAKAIIDEVWPYLDSIGLTGMGETFLYKDIEEIVDYVKQKNKGIIISVSTNAVLPDFIQKVSKIIGKIDTIQISIDGLESVYESIRHNASFETLDKNIHQLANICQGTTTTLMLNMVLTKENYFQMAELAKYADKTGIKYLDFSQLNLAAVTDIETSYYKFYHSKEFLNAIEELEKIIEASLNVTITYNFKTDTGFQKCPFPWSHFYVCWDGFIAPCCAKPFPKELNFGNVFNEKLIDILNSEDYQNFRERWFNNETPEFCKKCHFTSIQ
ncbi:MAG: radical SAM protein [Paludibacter sp.]|nr:radical SAM protein [Paludibacter sp.]